MVTRPTAKKVKSLDELLQAAEPVSMPSKSEENGILMIPFNKM
jgi:ParB family chromosome partitioning protein